MIIKRLYQSPECETDGDYYVAFEGQSLLCLHECVLKPGTAAEEGYDFVLADHELFVYRYRILALWIVGATVKQAISLTLNQGATTTGASILSDKSILIGLAGRKAIGGAGALTFFSIVQSGDNYITRLYRTDKIVILDIIIFSETSS